MELDLSTKSPGEQLRILRVFHNLKQTRAARRLGIDPSYLSLLETGDRSPSGDVAAKIEREFGIPALAWIEVSGRASA